MMPIRCFIRTDASTLIGSGHVMRCLALAGRLADCGAKVEFICRDLPGNQIARIVQNGFPVRSLPRPQGQPPTSEDPAHASLLGTTWQVDARETATVLQASSPADWLVVDHYALDARWETTVRGQTGRIFVIDDIADRDHDCDLLLDQNLHESAAARYQARLPTRCRRLLGPRYALLRPEFAAQRKALRVRDGRVERLLAFFGGSDLGNYTSMFLDALELMGKPRLSVDVVVGGGSPHRRAIEARCHELPQVRLHIDTSSMAELMASADLAIGAGGSSTWERACLRLPSIVVALAENQRELTAAMARHGALAELPDKEISAKLIADSVIDLINDPARLRSMAHVSGELVDGMGVVRVARELLAGSLTLRRANEADSDALYAWRNAEEVRRFSRNPALIQPDEHSRWLSTVLADPDRALLVAEQGGEPRGVLRYDRRGTDVVVSIYLVPGQSGQGLGPRLLLEGERWLAEYWPRVDCVHAEVLAGNMASTRAFLEAGYEPGPKTYMKRLQS